MHQNSPLHYSTPVLKKNQPDDSFKFQPLPLPSGAFPYHLDIASVMNGNHGQKIIFHMVGDTGSLRNPGFTAAVAGAMAKQCSSSLDSPTFLYHLGDIVYNHGEEAEYDRQFFIPYQQYPNPIFAIAGNHDSDVNLLSAKPYKSLDPFVKVFCTTGSKPVGFSLVKNRNSMPQPNVYWVLDTPLATIIGLHTNVPKFGIVMQDQRDWFEKELISAAALHPQKLLVICMHHSPYSADINHGSSLQMIAFLEEAFIKTGVYPDIVFGGHVHSYQRFVKKYTDGVATTYVVAGAGGYDELHATARLDDPMFTNDNALLNNVGLINYCDDKHGFLKITLGQTDNGVQLTGNYFSIAKDNPDHAMPADEFTVMAQNRKA